MSDCPERTALRLLLDSIEACRTASNAAIDDYGDPVSAFADTIARGDTDLDIALAAMADAEQAAREALGAEARD